MSKKRRNKRIYSKENKNTKSSPYKEIKWSTIANIVSAVILALSSVLVAFISKTNKVEYEYAVSNEWKISESSNYYPLKKGNQWVYKGEVTSYSSPDGEEYTKPVESKIEVIDEIIKGDIKVYIFNNYFNSLSVSDYYFYEENSAKAKLSDKECGIIIIGSDLYFIENSKLEKVKQELVNTGGIKDEKLIKPSLGDLEIIYRFPLFKGQRFGELDAIARSDLAYFWYVNDEKPSVSIENNKIKEEKIFELIYRTLGSYQKIDFKPYLGVTNYS